MKVKDFIKHIEEKSKEYPDIMEWELYTEQPDLIVPYNHKTLEEEKERLEEESKLYNVPFNQEWFNYLKDSEKKISELKKQGWKLVYDSEGWVYRDSAGNDKFMTSTLFPNEKIITINNNY